MPSSVIALVVVVLGGLALVRPIGWARRRWGRRALGDATIVREAEAIDLRVLLFRTRAFLGMRAGKPNAARADLLLTADRFLMTSDKGILADLGPERGRRFRSVRCTGPHRLVIEGQVPPQGQYRYEITIDDAPGWAEALAPFVVHDPEGPRYGSFQPGAPKPARRPPKPS